MLSVGNESGFGRGAGRLLALLLLCLCWAHSALAQEATQGPLAAGQLLIQGSRLTLYSDDLTTDADQTVNVGERARVRTCFGGVEDACGSVLPGDPRIAGLAVRGDLIGPEAPQGLPLETVPGGTFVLPGFQQEGDYRLENIRLVESASGRVLGAAEPSVAFLRVREIVLTSATVRTLSLAELAARGIELGDDNFQAFHFAVGFAFGNEVVEIELPLVYDGFGAVQELDEARVALDGLPSHVREEVLRWQPPHIVPFALERDPEEEVELKEDEEVDLTFPLFGAIVLPGNVSYLNQFFEARLIVANGAPAGTAVELTDLGAQIRLPGDHSLRVAASEPSVAAGQRVPVVAADGSRRLGSGEQASAAWTVEGLKAGTHTLKMDVTGQIERPGRDPLPVLSRTQAAVEVVDARFNLTFSHPDVVREGEPYSLFVTVTNLSRVTQNLISVDLEEQYLTGAHADDPGDDLRRTIETLQPGQAETVEYRLVAELDGKVVATTFQSDSSAGQGTIRLRTGVGELGIPLSPATLVLPRFSEQLAPPHAPVGDLLRANVRFLGLAYSLAVAPPAHLPPGLPRVITSDVERRAIDLGQAGHRVWLGEERLEALEILALDQLGNRHPLAEMDELRRRLSKGLAASEELALLLRHEQGARGLGALALLDHLAESASYAAPWMAAVVVPDGTGPAPLLEIRRPTAEGAGILAGMAGSGGSEVRALPFAEMYAVHETAGGGDDVPLAVVGHLADGEVFELVLRSPDGAPAAGRLVLILPDDAVAGDFRRVDLGRVDVPAGGAVATLAGAAVPEPSAGGFDVYDLATGAAVSASPTSRRVDRPPFRLVGARQDFRLNEKGPDPLGNMFRPNRYGNGVAYLFNRPPDPVAATTPASFRIRSTFSGLDTAGQPASGVSDKEGSAAWVQDDPRVVAVRYSTPLSALIDPADGQALLDHEHQLDSFELVDTWGESLSGIIPPPVVDTDPLHVGGLVGGRVLRGTGEPAEGSTVEMIRLWDIEKMTGTETILEKVGEVTTGADGAFYFDFVETPHWDGQIRDQYLLRATVPEGDDADLEPADVQEVGSTIRLQNRLARVNIALLGRGVVTGRLVYADDGSPVVGGEVVAVSTLFNDEKRAQVEADGSFRIGGVAVGPITLTGRDEDRRRVYATVGIEEPGATVDVLLEIQRGPPPGTGDVAGRIERLSTGDPVPGARITAYRNGIGIGSTTSDDLGRFYFADLPTGQITLQAAHFAVSRSSVIADLTLVADQTANVTLRLADGANRTVTGRVLFHDPVTNSDVPVEGAVAFIPGPGVFAYTDATGRYTLEGVPVQGVTDNAYQVKAIDYARKLEGDVFLPPITDASADVIEAQAIVLENMAGGVDGVVLDPLGRPAGGVEVVLYPSMTTTTGPDGAFRFDDVPLGSHQVLAHVGDGLQAGQVGWFGQSGVSVVYGGHRPFTEVRMGGAGVVTLHTTTATATGVLTPIYYKPTWYHDGSRTIKVKGAHEETTTDPDGHLELILPVGDYEIVAYNPFHGVETIHGKIDFQGQAIHHEIVFEDAATVAGQVVDVDGHTPVPDIEVTLSAKGLLPQKQITDAQGNFRFELVPKGRLTVTAAGLVGTVERVGRTFGSVDLGGQTLDLTVQMKAQGTVRGQVLEQFNGDLRPLPFAHYYVRENAWPYRRVPADGSWLATDADGFYQVSHLYAGGVTVVARDSSQVSRSGTARATLTTDWQVLDMPDVVMSTSVGYLSAVVRDPASGGPVADAQVRLSNGEVTVSGPDGSVYFDSLALGTYSLYAFHAPTGRSGRVGNLRLTGPGQELATTVYLDQRGEVRGTLYDDESRIVGVPGATVRLTGQTAGGRLTALATTSSTDEGRFVFLGIPEGTFDLEAGIPTSPRRARAEATLTETSPVADVVMVLEPVSDVYVQLFERLTGGVVPTDTVSNLFSVRMRQTGYDYTRSAPGVDGDGGSDRFHFPNMLLTRRADLSAQEVSGEQRSASAVFADFEGAVPLAGDGSFGNPYQLVLRPKGVVRVSVFTGGGSPVVGANVTLNASGTRFPSVTGSDGAVTFTGVGAGSLTASATSPETGTGGTARGSLTYDDEVVELAVTLAPSVSAHGTIYLPLEDDRLAGGAEPVPAPGIIVQLTDKNNDTQLVLTDDAGGYRFDVLPAGSYTLTARNDNGDQTAAMSGNLSGPDGYDNPLPGLVLDASPPRIVSITPPPGLEGVSRTAQVEIVFSEPLGAAYLPTGQSNAAYFDLLTPNGAHAAGVWTSGLDAAGFQWVRFTPSTPYQNFTTYSLIIDGGTSGVRDRAGRQLTADGDVGSNFKTADGIGPQVVGTDPTLALPVDPEARLRFDFNEAVSGGDELFDGDGNGDAVVLEGLRTTGEWVVLPVAIYLTRGGYSVEMEPLAGVTLSDDTGQRRVTVQGLADSYGNVMPAYQATYRVYDSTPPVVDAVPFPVGAADGQLTQGVDYVLVPALSATGATAGDPGGDVARVDYFFSDPTDFTNPVSPSYSAVEFPFAYPFVGAYSGDGETPKPFPVWVRAVDTSTNLSNVVLVEMVVLPNTSPSIGSLVAEATAPVAGTFYAGSEITATVGGLDDTDGSQLTLSVELRADGLPDALADSPDRLVTRPAEGWSAVAPESFAFTLPADLEEGLPLYLRATAIDSQGAVGELESERFPVADDTTPAVLSGLGTHLDDGRAETLFFIGESFYVEFRAVDAETGVESVEVELDRTDLFPEPLTAAPVAGDPGLYRTEPVAVPAGAVTDREAVVATVRAFDRGGNTAEETVAFEVAPEADPTAPVATWTVPRQGAAWPADHSSVVSPDGAAVLLRVEATDASEDLSGNLLPGNIVSVRFRGPWRDPATGAVDVDPTWRDGELVAGTDGPGRGTWRSMWRVPDGVAAGTTLPFEVRVEDSGGQVTVERLTLTAVPARRVYEAVTTAVAPTDDMLDAAADPAGAVFLLDGTTLSLRPQEDGTVRSLPAVHLLTGATDESGAVVARGSVLTAPEITTYDSAILFHPLELAVSEALTVAWGSRVDMTERGLLGNTPTRSMVLPGETKPEVWAGGSHGGRGGYGTSQPGYAVADLVEPGSVYDSLRDPYLPGGGGTAGNESWFGGVGGGAGGGVIRILAPGALIRLDGDIVADGGEGSGGGGAGGAVRLVAGRLEGAGRITANGESGSSGRYTGGGGGGRISVSYAELGPQVDLEQQLQAAGGDNFWYDNGPASRRAGAGTVFVQQLDAAGEPLDAGRLRIENPTDLRSSYTPLPALGDGVLASLDAAAGQVMLDVPRVRGDLTGDRVVLISEDGTALGDFPILGQARVADGAAPGGFRIRLDLAATEAELAAADAEMAAGRAVAFHGRGHLAAVTVAGRGRMVADDDLVLGAAGDTALNDRSRLVFEGDGRALLRGDAPVVTLTTDPAPGGDLLLGSEVTVSWQAADFLGLESTTTTWSLDGSVNVVDHGLPPLTASGGPVTVTIPVDAPAGAVSYVVESTDFAARSGSASAAWNVLPNDPPTAGLALAAGTVPPVQAGYPVQVVVDAADREGLAAVTLLASGPVDPGSASQTVAATGAAASLTFEVVVDAAADGSAPLVLQAMVEDTTGAQTVSATMEVAVAANAEPTATLTVADGEQQNLRPGESTLVTVQAGDPDGVATVELQLSGPATTTGETRSVSGTDVAETFTVTATADAVVGDVITAVAVVTDALGGAFTTPPVAIGIVGDSTLPEVTLTLSPAGGRYDAGTPVTITATATDDVEVSSVTVTGDGASEAVAGATATLAWTAPPVAGPTVFTFTAEATDPTGNVGTATVEITVDPLDDDVAPVIAFSCPTSGAVLPIGHQVSLTVTTSDDLGVAWVDFYADGEATSFDRVVASGSPLTFDATTTFFLGETVGSGTFRAEVVDSGGNVSAAEIIVDRVATIDLWADGEGINDWAALSGETVVLRSGVLTVDQPLVLGGLIVLDGAQLSHPFTDGSGPETSLDLEVTGPVYVACGGSVDATSRGYKPPYSHPDHLIANHSSGGSHMGVGGVVNPSPAETFGSVYFPRESGGGNNDYGRGGGVIRLRAGRLHVDGDVRADGQDSNGGGAGGSLWLETASLAGGGGLSAAGGTSTGCCDGSGGGGAVAVHYDDLEPGATLLDGVDVSGGAVYDAGGAGTLYLHGPGSVYGDLVISNHGVNGEVTSLPALGAGVAQSGSAGAVLVTDRSRPVYGYFVGHWVEVFDAVGNFKGDARIAAIEADGLTVTLDRDLAVSAGDQWRGVYRFDRLHLEAGAHLQTVDPLRVETEATFAGPVTLGDLAAPSIVVYSGVVTTTALDADTVRVEDGGVLVVREITAETVHVVSGGRLTQRSTPSSTAPESLTIEATEVVVESGASIDAWTRGYAPPLSYPDHQIANHSSGGSHLGVGGVVSRAPAETFGSVYYPQENGGGNNDYGRGGGTVRLVADRLQVDGSVNANGQSSNGGGAGGSVWLQVETLAGDGEITADGGSSTGCCDGSGGGGAVAIEYMSLEAGAMVLENLSAYGGNVYQAAGPGTIYLDSPSSVYGELRIDNRGVAGETILPALGSGTAQAGSLGSVLVTDRTRPVYPYFVGHWVEIYDAGGVFKGEARIAAIEGDGLTVTLDTDLGVTYGDLWQGIYRFDHYEVRGGAQLSSTDPIRTDGEVVVDGPVTLPEQVSMPSLVVRSGVVTATAMDVGAVRVEDTAVLVVREITADTVRVQSGGRLTQRSTLDAANAESLTIEADEVVVESGGAIDAWTRGYRPPTSYPDHLIANHSSGGSHIGVGGVVSPAPAETFGSVYFPQENGGGNNDYGNGGGAVRILARRLQVDGTVNANGHSSNGGGAGGSVWLQVETLAGDGEITADGGSSTGCCDGSGGGGAVAIEYISVEAGATVLENLSAYGGNVYKAAGPGTIYLDSPSSVYGELRIDNRGVTGGTVLPALGSGTAQAGSLGSVLVTDRTRPVYPYFIGHWVEIYDAGGVFKGEARIAAIESDGLTVTLDTDLGVADGDLWQGIYRFDYYTVRGGAQLSSADPIRTDGEVVVDGPVTLPEQTAAPSIVFRSGVITATTMDVGAVRVEDTAVLVVREITADTLRVQSGGRLTQRSTLDAANAESLTIEADEVVVESGGAIDAWTRGYRPPTSYPDHLIANHSSGGSHIGVGGVVSPSPAETFGSVYFPQENGGGNNDYGNGGGAVRILARRLQVDGTVNANGHSSNGGGAGGSVWLQVETLAGDGQITADGGSSTGCCDGSGGGGAVAIEYVSVEAGATVLENLSAYGGNVYKAAGPGTIYLAGPGSVYGELRIDNRGVTGGTVLPALGSGTAQAGSLGAVLVTDRARPVYPYFVGHWVEIYDAAGIFKGDARIAAIGSDGFTVTLDRDPGLVEGDFWQGIYRFDRSEIGGGAQLSSADPIRVETEVVVDGSATLPAELAVPSVVLRSGVVTATTIETGSLFVEGGVLVVRRIVADSVRVHSGARVTQLSTVDPLAPESLTIEAAEVVVEVGGAIDAWTRGYRPFQTYPGHGLPNHSSGGSHIGYGGVYTGPAGEIFGSVYFPQENGGGNNDSGNGGGVVRILAGRLQIDGTVNANGQSTSGGGGGGSVWLQVGTLAGLGQVSADGGQSSGCCDGSGGGGAVAIEYDVLEAGSTVLSQLSSRGGATYRAAGAGSVYVQGPSSVYGDLAVDNGGVSQTTELPSLGSGIAQPGSGSGVLVTDRATDVPPYFVGHWVRIETPTRVVKGTWRIAAVDGITVTLAPNGAETVDVVEGDEWFGVYLFDSVTVTGSAALQSLDEIIDFGGGFGAQLSAARVHGNDDPPAWMAEGVRVLTGAVEGSYRVEVLPSALLDPDGVSSVRLGRPGRWLTEAWSPEAGATFHWLGESGEALQLVALDAHGVVRATSRLVLGPLPASGWGGHVTGVDGVGFEVGGDVAENAEAAALPAVGARRDTDEGPARVVSAARFADQAIALLAVHEAEEGLVSGHRLALIDVEGAWEVSPVALPANLRGELVVAGDFLHLLPKTSEGDATVLTWPAWNGLQAWAAEPLSHALAGGWRQAVAWPGDGPPRLVLAGESELRLVSLTEAGWQLTARVPTAGTAWSVTTAGDRLFAALPGSVVAWDVSDPSAPREIGRLEGSAYRQIVAIDGGEAVRLEAPGFDVPPVVVPLSAFTATAGAAPSFEAAPSPGYREADGVVLP